MSIDQQLRAALTQEAAMQTAPPPDVDRLIIGGKVRRRRRTWVRVGIAAVVALFVAGGAYGVTKAASGGTAVGPAGSPSPTPTPATWMDTGDVVGPGKYRMPVGTNDVGAMMYADMTFGDVGWEGDNYPVLAYPNGNGGVAVYQPLGLSGGNGCLENNKLNTENIGDTPQTLAQQLARLPQSTVLKPPTPVQAFGRDAVHLQLRIDNNCTDVYRVAETIRGGHGITYDPVKPVIIDFWVLEDGGVPVVAEKWVEDGAPSQVVDEVARTADSITFESGT